MQCKTVKCAWTLRGLVFSGALLPAHFRSTSVSLVGLQVWRGSLLLADYLVAHNLALDLDNARVIELAAGTGITSITCAALGAKSVLCTGESVSDKFF